MTDTLSASGNRVNHTVDWGRTRYALARSRQEEMVAERIEEKIGDTLIFTEHDPVFTMGLRRGAELNLVWSLEQLASRGVEVVKTNRGGDITYHGPGQIVGYPILNLAPRKDLHVYLRFLERVVIESLSRFGLAAARRDEKTGIWLGKRKVAAIGVAVRRWVSYHGFALNVDVDLTSFDGIIPCGISSSEGTVTSMQQELGHSVDSAAVKCVLSEELWKLLPQFLEGKAIP